MLETEQNRFGALAQHQDKLDQFFRYKHIGEDDIPDLRQETFRRALFYFRQREVCENLWGLLSKIARGVIADHLEAKRIRAERAEPLEESAEHVSPSNPELELHAQEVRKHLAEVLSYCNEEARALILARFDEGKSLDEIAAEMKMPLSTAHFQIQRAIGELAIELRQKRKIVLSVPIPPNEGDRATPTENAPASEPGAAPKSDRPVTLAQPKTPSIAPGTSRKKQVAAVVFAAIAAALAVYFWMQRPPLELAEKWPRFIHTFGSGNGVTASTPFAVPAGILGSPVAICPEPMPAPPSPSPAAPPPKGGALSPGDQHGASKARDIYHIYERAYRAGDCETARVYRKMLSKPFAEAVAKWRPCTPAQ